MYRRSTLYPRLRSVLKKLSVDETRENALTDLKSCSLGSDLHWGRTIHAAVLECRTCLDTQAVNALINMYRKCRSMADALSVFRNIHQPTVLHWTSLLAGYAENGEGIFAIELFSTMKYHKCEPNFVTYMAAIKACTSLIVKKNDKGTLDCLELGRKIHMEIGCHLNHRLQTTLVDMYCKCGSIADARRVFDGIENPDVVSWTALLLGYADNGQGDIAMDLFEKMKASGFVPDSQTYVAALKVCASVAETKSGSQKEKCLRWGREIHSEVGCYMNHYVQTALIDMYSKCSCICDARNVFDSIKRPDVTSWNALLLGYAENGDGYASLDLLTKMKQQGPLPNSVTYIAALKACTSLAAKRDDNETIGLECGRRIHSEIGCRMNHYLQTTLIDMYSQFGSMRDARSVFDNIKEPNLVAWNALLLGYAENREGHVTLDLFGRMKTTGFAPDSMTYVAVLMACGTIGALAMGRKFHKEITEFTFHVVTSLVDFYAKCGSMDEAHEVLETYSSTRNISTWTALLAGYARFGDSDSVFNIFKRMEDEGVHPDAVTFVCLLLCCNHAGLVEKATECFEAMTQKYGLVPSIIHYNCMVDVLGRGNQLDKALTMMRKMPCSPNVVTWTTLLSACCKWKNVDIGREAYQALIDIDKDNASPFVLMAEIYQRKGMWEERHKVLEARIKMQCDIPKVYTKY